MKSDPIKSFKFFLLLGIFVIISSGIIISEEKKAEEIDPEIENIDLSTEEPAIQGDFIFIEGDVQIKDKTSHQWTPVTDATKIEDGTEIMLGSNSFVEVVISSAVKADAGEETKFKIIKNDTKMTLDMIYGSMKAKVKKLSKAELEIKTPISVAAVRGTEFAVVYEEENNSEIEVYDGSVAVSNISEKGDTEDTVVVEKDNWAEVNKGEKPTIKGIITAQRKLRWNYIRSKKELFKDRQRIKRLKIITFKLSKLSKMVRDPERKKKIDMKLDEVLKKTALINDSMQKNDKYIKNFRSDYQKMRMKRRKSMRKLMQSRMKSRIKNRQGNRRRQKRRR